VGKRSPEPCYVGILFVDGQTVAVPDCGPHDTYDLVVATDEAMVEALRSANRTVRALTKIITRDQDPGRLPL
jgi:hypothetical protein